ncbi:hypothetical protein ACR6C2_14945 [Streptomyces sp. INA 01156]
MALTLVGVVIAGWWALLVPALALLAWRRAALLVPVALAALAGAGIVAAFGAGSRRSGHGRLRTPGPTAGTDRPVRGAGEPRRTGFRRTVREDGWKPGRTEPRRPSTDRRRRRSGHTLRGTTRPCRLAFRCTRHRPAPRSPPSGFPARGRRTARRAAGGGRGSAG